jgi:luciferase family oxidoreductase group 1
VLVLSVLDQSPIAEGATGADALRNTLDLAQLADRLGYRRYWVAEHHGGVMLAGTSPEVLLGALGAATQRIRVGSGGVMLPHYSPLKVAESFRLLSSLYPDRIDLGLGRAPGSDGRTAFALQRDRSRAALADDFPQQLLELLAYLDGGLPAGHPFASIELPEGPNPEPWLLGSSQDSAIWAAELGLPYCFADFINPRGAEIAELYRSRFQPSERNPEPQVAIGVSAICADGDEEAERLALSARMAMTQLRRGTLIPVPPVEKAEAWFARPDTPPMPSGRRLVLGTPAKVRAGIEAVAAEYGASEVVIVSITYSHAARRRSYELIAKAFA